MPDWKDYQEEAATFFRSLGLKAETDVSLKGVRTGHDIDVVVEVDVAGFSVRWLVECKHWKSPVSKLHVLALREIVSDIGADRGIILCEVGFQSGAIEAANLTNIQVSSLASLSVTSSESVYAFRLRELLSRNEVASERYWNLPKQFRIDQGLRFEFPDGVNNFSGARVVDTVRELLSFGFRAEFPISVHGMARWYNPELPEVIRNNEELAVAVEALVVELERRLDVAGSPAS